MADTQPDKIEGLPHPRETLDFIGNEAAEYAFYKALQSGKLHHAWILAGPKGVGKATLAYRFARRYLGAKPSNESPLASAADDNIVKLIASDAMPDLRVATRFCPEDEKIKRDVSVAAIRNLTSMFDLKATNPMGRRVAIIDSVDDMRDAASNALLKTLEEPPKGAIIILIANSLGAVLPTIKSRCSLIKLRPLADEEMKKALGNINPAVLALSKGAIGRARELSNFEIEDKYILLARHLNSFPHCPIEPAMELANSAKSIEAFDIIFELINDWLQRAIKAGIGLDVNEIEVGESANFERLTKYIDKEKLFKAWENLQKLRQAVGNNLDKTAAIIEALNIIKRALAQK